jgi:branched-chain amino acid transport system substrate-binding protein
MNPVWKIFLIVMIWSNFSCTASKGPQQVIRIGEYGSLSGSEATFGQGVHNGIQLAIDQANQAGGIEGRRLELVTKDEKGELKLVQKTVEELIQKDNVIAIIGEVASHRSLIAAPIAQKHKVPMVSPSSTNPKVTEIGDHIFRVCFIDSFQGQVMAQFAYKQLHVRNVAILRDKSSDYSRDLADYFSQAFKKLGGRITNDQEYTSGDIDFKEQLVQIRRDKPQAIYIPGYYSEVGLIARQARQLGIEATFLGGDGWDSTKLFQIGRDAIKGSYFSNHFSAQSPNEHVQRFVRAYRERFAKNPDGLAAGGYDAAMFIIEALKRAKTKDRPGLAQALRSMHSFEGALGNTSIDRQRNALKPAFILRVNGTSNKYITTIKP